MLSRAQASALFGVLDPQARAIRDDAGDRRRQEHHADGDHVALVVEITVEGGQRGGACDRCRESHPQAPAHREQQDAEHVQHAARHAGVEFGQREEQRRDRRDNHSSCEHATRHRS
jgi:hypothetical protein